MNRQDEFNEIINKYGLWENDGFLNRLPEQINLVAVFDDTLDQCYSVPEHMPKAKYSEYLKEHDEIAYRCSFADHTDVFREDYFERNDEEFYPVEGIQEAINETLQEMADAILEDMLV